MSSYPPDQPDNADEAPSPFKRKLNFGDYLFMAMNPHAGQLLSHITNLHNQEADRAYKRKRDKQADELHQAQLKRLTDEDASQRATEADKRKKESFDTERTVVKEGGRKVKSMEDLFKYDANNTVISRAPGEAYAVPTERATTARKQADKDTEAKVALQRKIEEKKAMGPLDVKEALDKQTALMPGDLTKIGAQAEINKANRQSRIVTSTDDNGNTTITAVDDSGQPVGQTGIGKVGKSGSDAKAAGGMSTKAEKTLVRTQKAIDAVKSPDAKDVRSDSERFDAAVNAVKLAVAAHPGELEGGVDKASGWPYVKPKAGGRAAAAGSRTMSAAEYQSAVSKHGKDAADAWLAKKGITVQ